MPPALARLGVLLDVGDLASGNSRERYLSRDGAAARDLGIELVLEEVRAVEELDGAFARMAGAGAEAVVLAVRVQWTAGEGLVRLIEGALRYGMPTMGWNRISAQTGTLVAYGADIVAIYGRTAEYVDKVLRGARPEDIPIENPDRFEFVINLNTARTLGLTVPPAVIARATEVIQ